MTDANVVLGYINPAHLVGGALKLDAEKARAAIAERIARPLGMSVEEAAYGAHLIAASNMIRALKAVSSERGRDPREYALVAFGGNGPIFAAGMAEAMGMPLVLIPPSAGVFSSFGLLYAEVEYHFARTRKLLLRDGGAGGIAGDCRCARSRGAGAADRRRVRARSGSRSAAAPACIIRANRSNCACRSPPAGSTARRWPLSRRRSAPSTSAPTAIAPGSRSRSNWSASKSSDAASPETPRAASAAAASLAPDIAIAEPRRSAYFGPGNGWLDAELLNRSDLRTPAPGPCIVEEYDSTCLVPPGWTARLDAYGNIAITRSEG